MSRRDVPGTAQEAMQQLVGELDPGCMATRFVALVEIIDAEGERAVWCLTPPGARDWDTLGLLRYGQAIEEAAITADKIGDP